MNRQKKTSLRTRLLLLVTFIVLLGYALTLTLLSRQSSAMQYRTALQYTTQLAISEGSKATHNLEQGLDVARTLAQALGGMKITGLADRAQANALLKGVLNANPEFLGVWTGWEPDAFDAKTANTPACPATTPLAATCPPGIAAATAPPYKSSHWSITTNLALATFINWPKPADKKPCWSPIPINWPAKPC